MTDVAIVERLLPEIALVVGATVIYLMGAYGVASAASVVAGRTVLLVSIGLLAGPGTHAGIVSLHPMLYADPFATVLRWSVLACGLILLFGWPRRDGPDRLEGERIGSVLLILTGCMLVSQAADVTLLFVSLELLSIPIYALLFLGRRTERCSESALKYFLLSIFSSAMLLYGLGLLYAVTGSTTISAAEQGVVSILSEHGFVPCALMLVVVGIGFKLAAVPMQFYAADVYEGNSAINAGLLAVAPKVAGIAALLRLLSVWGPEMGPWLVVVFGLITLATMTFGNFVALWQSHVRRLFAYSSVAHAGYLFIGLTVIAAGGWPTAWEQGASAVLLYLLVYAVASLGAFCALDAIRIGGESPENVGDLSGLARREPALAFALAVFMFSLAGIPPLAGFWGKLGLFSSAVSAAQSVALAPWMQRWFIVMAVAGAMNAAVAAAYYLKLIGLICLCEPESSALPVTQAGPRRVAVGCAVILVLIGCFPQRLVEGFRNAAVSAVSLPPAVASDWTHRRESPQAIVAVETVERPLK